MDETLGKQSLQLANNTFDSKKLDATFKTNATLNIKRRSPSLGHTTALGPLKHGGYAQTYKGQLHMMSIAVSNNIGV